ncbi:MAG: nicotinate phosphoribosyltransferase [Desulfovibrionaceae bacterium]|nr:nicotinate phosphoribosyltransferase [Desulfovibrionaceae bacterium]
MSQFDARNLSLVMDLYEMTMANGYMSGNSPETYVCFDVFYRHNPDNGGFAIFAGLEQVLDYLENIHFAEDDISYLRSLGIFPESFLERLAHFRFSGDIDAFPEGSVMYPNEPILTVHAPLLDAQMVETAVLNQINHQSLIATKAQRIVHAARGRGVADFGARRAHNMDAAVYGARAAYIGGVASTATVLAGKMFGIPVTGTMAHSWVMYHKDEYTAFRRYAETYPDCAVLLVDTYNVIHSGIPNAIRVAKEVLEPMGKRLKGVRIDSGDLAYLSKRTRAMLDEAGLTDCTISASNSLDEYTISSLIDQGGCIDSFGVGERLITARSEPVFGAVYKLVSVEENGKCEPRIKISETVEKITNPGRKRVYRVYNQENHAISDLMTLYDETVDTSAPYRYVNPAKPWRSRSYEGFSVRELQQPVMRNGKRTGPAPSLKEIRDFVARQLRDEIWEEEQRFENPHLHKLVMSPAYYETKMDLLYRHSEEYTNRHGSRG